MQVVAEDAELHLFLRKQPTFITLFSSNPID